MDEMLLFYLYLAIGAVASLVITVLLGLLCNHAPFGDMTFTILFMVFVVLDFLLLASLLTLGVIYLILAIPLVIGG